MNKFRKVQVFFDKCQTPITELLGEEPGMVVDYAYVDFSDIDHFYYRDKNHELNDTGRDCTIICKKSGRILWLAINEEEVLSIINSIKVEII